jgi:hypothetical protein
MSLLKDLIGFIRMPGSEKNWAKSVKFRIYDTIGLYVLKLIMLIPVVLFFALIYDPENVQRGNMSERFTPLLFLLIGGVILPFLEEVAFRLSLKFKPAYLALSAGVLSYYILTKVVFHTKMSAFDESLVMRVAISILLSVLIFPVVIIKPVKEKLTNFWELHFRSIYYISCLVFAWVHITKYELSLTNILLLPILTLPQLMSALIYGYIRVSFGFQYPLVLHMSNNMIGIGLSFLPFTDLIAG